MTIDRSVALAVEGMGNDPLFPNGVAFYSGRTTIPVSNGYEWVGGTGSGEGLINPPLSVASKVNPFDVTFQGSAFTFEIHGSEFAKGLWLPRPLKPFDSLSAAIEPAATTVVFSGNGGWSAADDGSVVWTADEAILLGTHTGGSTFTGCTRAYYSTTAIYLPAGMSVYQTNPKHELRRAVVYVYDHATDEIEQFWQGFTKDFKIVGPKVIVQAAELLTSTAIGVVNRGANKDIRQRFLVWRHDPDTQTVIGGGGMRTGTIWEKRVTKESAVEPHWLAIQLDDAGGYYAEFNGGAVEFIDNDGTAVGGSDPIMGGTSLGSFEGPAIQVGNTRAHELLVVDRLRDSPLGIVPAYANFRSSTRSLKYPYHPVAISMALLTSGPDAMPGVAGTGAEGSDSIGVTPELGGPLGTLVEFLIYATATNGCFVEGFKHLPEAGWMSSHYAGTVGNFPQRLDVDGSVLWTFTGGGVATDQSGGQASLDFDYVNGRIAFGCFQQGTTPTGTVGRCNFDGSAQTTFGNTGSSGFDDRNVIYDPVADRVLVVRGFQSAFITWDLTVGAGSGDVWTPLPAVAWRSGGKRSDDRILMCDDSTDSWSLFQLPVSGAGNDDYFARVVAADITGSLNLNGLANSISEDNVDGGWWCAQNNNPGQTYIVHIDKDGVVDLEVDMTPHFTGMTSCRLWVDCDREGNVYVAKQASGAASEVARLSSAGAHVWTVSDVFPVEGNTLEDIAVDSAGNVIVTNVDDYGTIITQA